MANGKVIFHIDMNSFFASCEVAENPNLAGKKVIVAHQTLDKKGMVLAATYEAKACGIKTTMLVYEAERLCPDAVFVDPHYDLYTTYSRKFFDYLYKITPNIEPASIDEGYMDVTDLATGEGYIELAKKIQSDIYHLYGLPSSIGIGPNLFLAKMGSDMKKPMGITVVRKRDVPSLIWPLPIEDMMWAGKKTCEALRPLGIKTIGDLANFKDQELLISLLGSNNANSLIAHANGSGSNIVDPNRYDTIGSISNSHTFDKDEYNINEVKLLMKLLSNSLSERLEKKNLVASTFTLQIKYNNFKTYSKAITVDVPTNNSYQMINYFESLFEELYDTVLPVRLVGVAANKLSKNTNVGRQMTIFDDFDKESLDFEVNKVIKNINSIVGNEALIMGVNNLKKNK